MKFSIILPIYNVEAYLRDCVDSILQQTFTDYELILVDDGSKDGSPAICDEYAKKDNRIKVVHQQNAGQSAARNKGLSIAAGDYVVFIDSDDFVTSKDFLKELAEKSKDGADVIFYKYRLFLDKSKTLCDCRFSYQSAIGAPTLADKLQKLVEADAFFGMAWIRAVRRLLLINNDIVFTNAKSAEDTDWNYSLLEHTKKIDFVDAPFLAYRQRDKSVSHSVSMRNLNDFVAIIFKWANRFNQLQDETLKQALLSSLAKYYSNLLVVYMRVDDKAKEQQKQTLKDLSWLLRYSRSKRPKMVAKVYKLFGFDMTIMMLNLLDKLKK